MDEEKIIEKLMDKAKVSYEDGRKALREADWNILDAMLILEDEGKVKKPEISIFFTNKKYEKEDKDEVIKIEYRQEERRSFLQRVIENFCMIIDRCNNIFFRIMRNKKVLIKFPLTVILILLFFAFWVVVPLFIIGFFFDIQYSFTERGIENKNINAFLERISREVQYRKKNRKGKRYE